MATLQHPNTTSTTECGYGSYLNENQCISIPSPLKCQALYLYTTHRYIHIQLTWDNIQYPSNYTHDHPNDEIRYIIHYLTQYNTQDLIITKSNEYLITNSFLNTHINNYTEYYLKNVALIQTIFNYNTHSNQYLPSSLSNTSTNCTFIIPSLTTPSPTITTANIFFNGTFCNQKQKCSNQKHLTIKYNSINKILNALNHTYIIRNPILYFEYDLFLFIQYCINSTSNSNANRHKYICNENMAIFYKNATNMQLPIKIPDTTIISDVSELNAITMNINCSILPNKNETILTEYNCILGQPNELTFILNRDENINIFTLWWFWFLMGLILLIIFCIFMLFQCMCKHKRLTKKLYIARNELHVQQRDNDQIMYDSSKLKQQQPDMNQNPIGTGIPNSIPLFDPIEQEINIRKQKEQYITNNVENMGFEYKIKIKPNVEKSNENRKKRKEKKDLKGQEMIELDAKGRKKNQVWKTSFEEPLLQ